MHVLAIDTSTYVGSVALVSDGALRAELSAHVRAKHGEVLLPHIERVLELGGVPPEALDLVAVGVGPGSFTGVRIGVATAKGLAIARGTPLVGVLSLRVIARGMSEADEIAVPVVDAHKGEVYVAAYGTAGPGPLQEWLAPFHAPPAEAASRLRDAVGVRPVALAGDGLRRHRDAFLKALGEPHVVCPAVLDTPRAALLALEGEERFVAQGSDDVARIEPVYLRPSDAKLPDKPLRT